MPSSIASAVPPQALTCWLRRRFELEIDLQHSITPALHHPEDLSMKLKDKVAVVTGGGRGIGKAVAIAYAREDAKLALCARTASELEKTVAEIRNLNTDAQGWVCDVSDESAVK